MNLHSHNHMCYVNVISLQNHHSNFIFEISKKKMKKRNLTKVTCAVVEKCLPTFLAADTVKRGNILLFDAFKI